MSWGVARRLGGLFLVFMTLEVVSGETSGAEIQNISHPGITHLWTLLTARARSGFLGPPQLNGP